MQLSLLQKFILLTCLERRGKVERNLFRRFYGKQSKSFGSRSSSSEQAVQDKPAKEKYQENIITKSLEHLIDRELMMGYGRRTPHKWFVTHVALNKKGAKVSQNLLEEKQTRLPLK